MRQTQPLALILGLVLLVLAAPAPADRFEDAVRYTVKVRSATPVPLIYDSSRGGTGAGFLVDRERGWILTNAHVAGYGPSEVEVSFHGRGFVAAEVRYVDTHLDLAVLTVDPAVIPGQALVAQYDCERDPRTGEDVIAFGHPWDLDYTATRGIVSGVSTSRNRQWIQTDAPLNQGNSGGPLISLDSGNVVGINALMSADESMQNLNFAVPMREVCVVLSLLRAGVDPTPASLPFTVAAREHGGGGLVIARVPDQAGHELRPGDHVVRIGEGDGPPANQTELYRELRGVSGRIPIEVERAGERIKTEVSVQRVPSMLEHEGLMIAGVLFAPVSPDLARAESSTRLMVHWVERGTPGSIAGFNTFDLVEAVNGRSVHTLAELRTLVESLPDDATLQVVHRRITNGNTWWNYSERLLPARPYQPIARD